MTNKPAPLQIIILFDGQTVSVNGPIDNPLICMRMIGDAMTAIVNHNSKKPQLELVKP